MTTAYSSLLGLALPVQGELAGQWGDTVNDYITKYLDASIAGSLSITADVTLTKTTGTTLGATSSQYAILTCSPSSVNIVVTAPAAYKIYVVNNTSASYTVTIRGATPTSGVVLAALEKAVVAWNGSDFFKVATSATDGVSTFSAGSTGLTPNSATSGAVTLAGTLAVANGGTGLTAGTSGGVLAYTATGTLASSTALAASALVIGGGAGAAPSTTTTGTGVVTALGVNTGSAGAFVVNGGALGTPASGTVTNLTGTASININGTVGATTAAAGAFTTVTASGTVTATGQIVITKAGSLPNLNFNQSTNAAVNDYSGYIGTGGPNASGVVTGWGDLYWQVTNATNGTEASKFIIEVKQGGADVTALTLTSTGLNSTVIGATTPAAGSFTTLNASGAITYLTATNAQINAGGTTGSAWFGNSDTTAGWASYGATHATEAKKGVYYLDGVAKLTITSTGLNSTVIGATTPAAGSFTTGKFTNDTIYDLRILGVGGDTPTLRSVYNVTSQLRGLGLEGNAVIVKCGSASDTTGTTVATFSSTGLAVTGALSATKATAGDVATFTNAAASNKTAYIYTDNTYIGFGSTASVAAGDKLLISVGNWAAVYGTSAVYQNVGGSTITTVSSTGLAVTGTLSATGTTTVGIGGTGANDGIVVLNGSSALNQGSYINFRKNSVDKIYIGTGSSVIGGTLDSLCLSALVGAVTTYANGTKVLDVDKDKSLALQGATSQTGTGITFPATQNASADANTLDDYKEGTWTPGISFGGGTTGVTYNESYHSGRYTKVGRLVTVDGYFVLTSKGSSTGAALITGLPIATAAASAVTVFLDGVSFANVPQSYGNVGDTTIYLGEITEAGAISALDDTNFANTSQLKLSFSYTV